MEGLRKCNVAGIPQYNAHIIFLYMFKPLYLLGEYKNIMMYVIFFTPEEGQGYQEGSNQFFFFNVFFLNLVLYCVDFPAQNIFLIYFLK